MSCRCANCEKMVLREYCVLYNKQITPIEFCSRKCYLSFWAKARFFKPLPSAPKKIQKNEKSACA